MKEINKNLSGETDYSILNQIDDSNKAKDNRSINSQNFDYQNQYWALVMSHTYE